MERCRTARVLPRSGTAADVGGTDSRGVRATIRPRSGGTGDFRLRQHDQTVGRTVRAKISGRSYRCVRDRARHEEDRCIIRHPYVDHSMLRDTNGRGRAFHGAGDQRIRHWPTADTDVVRVRDDPRSREGERGFRVGAHPLSETPGRRGGTSPALTAFRRTNGHGLFHAILALTSSVSPLASARVRHRPLAFRRRQSSPSLRHRACRAGDEGAVLPDRGPNPMEAGGMLGTTSDAPHR